MSAENRVGSFNEGGFKSFQVLKDFQLLKPPSLKLPTLFSADKKNHGRGRVVSASGSETSVLSSTPTSAITYDAHTCIIKNKIRKASKVVNTLLKAILKFCTTNQLFEMNAVRSWF